MASTGLVAGLIFTGQAFADSHENIIVSHGYSEYGELKYPADFEHLDYVNPDAPVGGEISVSANGTFDSMNPYATVDGTYGYLSSAGYERILTGTGDEVGSAYCLLCETIEYPESQDWVIFNLHKNITFSDGTPGTAHDIVYSHELLKEQGTPSYARFVQEMVTSAEALDDYTVKFTFADGVPRKGLMSLVGSTPMWSKAWYEETGARLDEARLEISPGTAEYNPTSVDVGRQIILTRNPDYWAKDLPIARGRGNFDSIRVEYFADSSAAFEGFKAGEFTFRRENSSINWATAYDFPAIESGAVVRETIEDGTPPFASGFVFNLRREKFQDVRVREALGLVYNFTWTNDNLQYGLFQQRESFWENDQLKAVDLPQGRELEMLDTVRDMLNPEIFTEPAVLPHTSGDRPLDRGNLRRALGLLEEAGFVAGDDGILRKDGNTLEVEFLETRQSFDRIINPYIDNLKSLGVDITYNRVDGAQYQLRTQENDFDMIFGSYRAGLEESTGLEQRYGAADKDDVFNPAGFSHPAVDELIKYVIDAETYDELAAGLRAIDRIMRAERFIVPVWYLGKHWTAYFDMYEHPENLPPFGLGHLDYWWINADKAEALRSSGVLR